MPGRKPGQRRVEILHTLARMLEAPRWEKITTAALAFCVHESISVLEKLNRSGVYLPPFMVVLLKRLKKTTDSGSGGIVFPEIRVNHVQAKVESDVQPTEEHKVAMRVAEKRAKRAESVLEEVSEQQRENSAILKSIGDSVAKHTDETNQTQERK